MEAEKECFKCGETKGLSFFYKHPMMADGRLGKCKECAKRDTRKNRQLKIDYYRQYDRERGNRQTLDYQREYRRKNPEKYEAHKKVGNAVRDGRLKKEPCSVCGSTENLHAHHEDYSNPLEVTWLCAAHHRQLHTSDATP